MESTLPIGGQFKDVSAGYYHSCLLDLAGTATCWGLNPYGETKRPALASRLTRSASVPLTPTA